MPIYQTRWSAKQLRDIANAIKGKKRDVISKSSFGDLLYISPLVPPPEGLLDFIVMRIDTKKRVLKINDHKEIHFSRDMVKKIFNVPSGSRPVEFGKRGKADFREVYLDGERAPIATTVAVISKADDDDEETIESSWALLCLALVLAPGTGNMVPLEYLYALRDMSVVHEFEFDEHILFDVMTEVKKYQDKRNEGKVKFLIGGCLPMLPIIYMDHLDVPRGCLVDHTINYSLPRACFVNEMDFYAVIEVDTLGDGFGKWPFSKSTPYAATEFISYIDQQAQGTVREEPPEISDQGGAVAGATHTLDVPESSHFQSNVQVGGNAGFGGPPHAGNEGTNGSVEHVHEPPPSNTDGGDDVCGSLEERLHALPTFKEIELPLHLQVIYNKHKELHATELNAALRSFGMVLQGMYCKRMGLMLSEAHKAECSIHEHKDEGEDVTFSVPGGASPEGMSDDTATTTEPSPPPQQRNIHPEAHGAAGMVDATATEPCMQHPKRPDDTKSSEPVVEVGHNNAAPPKMSDHSNGKGNGRDLCSKVNNTEQKSPRSQGFPFANFTRRPCTLEDGPSFGLFEPGSDDDILFQEVPEVRFSHEQSSGSNLDSLFAIRARSPLFDDYPTTSTGPVFDVTPLATCPPISTGPAEACVNEAREEVVVEVSSGRSHVDKKAKLKRATTSPEVVPKLKKVKVDATDNAIYKQYCCTHYQIKDPPKGEPLPPFIKIGGFEISLKHFSSGLKKCAHLNNEVMSLYIKSFNIENMYSSCKPKKFAFSPHMASKLAVDPSSFQTCSCIKDFERACDRNNIAKCDQLFFTLVKNGHWAVLVVNLIQTQFSVFDSNSDDPEYSSTLEQPCSNLIANFKTLVRERNPLKHDLDKFHCFSPDGYPQQSTTFDCGFFAILYIENLTARGMKPFKTDTRSLLNFRTFVAAKLFKHPQNTLDSAEEFQKLLRSS